MILHKYDHSSTKVSAAGDSKMYWFDDDSSGSLGRISTVSAASGNSRVRVVEHGFWDRVEGMRRTVVLIYDEGNGDLDRICFLQQKKITSIDGGEEDGGNSSFDVSDINEMDLSVMPKTAPFDLGEVRRSWRRRERSRPSDGGGGGKEGRVEILTVSDGTYREEEAGAEDDDEDGFLADLL